VRVSRKAPRRWWFFRAGPPGHLDFDLVRHGLPLLGCAAVWMGAHGWRKRLPPMSFVRARTDARGGERVNQLDRAARERLLWKDPLRARFYSNLLANFLVPAGTVGLAVAAGVKGGGGPLSDVLVANEAMVYAGTISQAAKIYFRRQRPFARFASERPPVSERPIEAMEAADAGEKRALALARANQIDDDDLSFFSSHTSTTAAFAFAVAQIATRRRVRTPLGVGIAGTVAQTGNAINLPDAYGDPRFNRAVDLSTGYRTTSLLCVPMFNATGDVVGVIQALNKRGGVFGEDDEELLLALGGQAASAVENALLHEEIQRLFEGFVKASVVAIESRDPTTAGHSERVARLTLGLAAAVEQDDKGAYAGIHFTPEQRMEIRYAALLHDFGKVGVREHVLVKANKFHPHELAMVEARFDYARRSLEAESLKRQRDRIIAGESPGKVLLEEEGVLEARLREIDAALELVRRCNKPTVLPAGISGPLAELARVGFPGPDGTRHTLLSETEVDLLSIPKGSLSPAERLEIQSHVTHTFRFLSQIPWTRNLKRVPEIAAAHHEKLDGTGYPLAIPAESIGIESRMMAIADIFDALTVSDRPYKKAVAPDLALEIIEAEVKEGKLDGDLFRVFHEADVPGRALAPSPEELIDEEASG